MSDFLRNNSCPPFVPPGKARTRATASNACLPRLWRHASSALLGWSLLVLLGVGSPDPVSGGLVTWDVDPTNSYIRLTLPDQTLNVTNIGSVTVKMRDANSTSQWTDAGGRRAALDGQILTEYEDGASIQFLAGSHNLYAVEGVNLRPNPAEWSAATTNYTGTTAALAALGGRVRGTYAVLFTFDAAFVAFRNAKLDIANAAPAPIPLTNGVFAANSTQTGIASALADVDGLEVLTFGQPIPDMYHAALAPVVQTNTAAGGVTNLGGLNRKLNYPINIPNLAMDMGGTLVTGSAAGLVVAYAVLPTPPPPPTLSVQRQGNNVVLAWPVSASGFSLQYSAILPATNWLAASPSPVVVNGNNYVTNAVSGPGVFYRLRKP